MSLMDVFRHYSSIYVFNRVDPVDDLVHEGSLVVVTDREPNEAWLAHVDQIRRHRPLERIGGLLDYPPTLGRPDSVFDLHGHCPERVLAFPRYSF